MSDLWQKNLFRALCQGYINKAFDLLVEIVENRNAHESARIQGLKLLIEHACGKAPQTIEVKPTDDIPPDMMTTEQLKLAAAGQTRELFCSLMEQGKFEEYVGRYEVVDDGTKRLAMRPDMDIDNCIVDVCTKDDSEGADGIVVTDSKEAEEAQG